MMMITTLGKPAGAGSLQLLTLGAAVFIVINTLLVTSVAGQGYENDDCTIKDGSPGVCSLTENCPWYSETVVKNRLQEGVRCGWKDASTEIICCKSAGAVAVGSRASGACADWPQSSLIFHIAEGEEASEGEFPFMASLGYRNADTRKGYDFRCGASLISPNFLLTAAHCMKGGSPLVALFGTLNLNNPNLMIRIKKIYRHKSYSQQSKHNDIALIELDREIKDHPQINPICLHMVEEDRPLNENLTTIGFGITDSDTWQRSTVLMKVDVNTVPLDQCKKSFRADNIPATLVATQYCALGRKNTVTNRTGDACEGDSGGPLIMEVAGSPRLVGVTSYGIGCGANVPGIYTRVASYVEWIESIVWPS